MTPRIAKLPLVVLLSLGANGFAQEGKVIDVFDDQSNMAAAPIVVQSTSDDGDDSGGDFDDQGDYSGQTDGGFTLEFEKNGSSILVPAVINGHGGYFIFDTGATYTTITSQMARVAGVTPSAKNPSMSMRTANGVTRAKLGVIDNLVLGGRPHAGVTFTVCDSCPDGMYKGKPLVGLLGMNVIGRYRTTFDHSRGFIEMSPTGDYSDRSSDIEPWLHVEEPKLARNAKGWDIPLKNRSPRKIREMAVRYWCEGGTPRESSRSIGAGQTVSFNVQVKDGNCREGFHRKVVNARW